MRGPPRRSRAAQALRLGWDLARSPALVARHRRELAMVRTTCLFVGSPKTGHSLVGALLDAHPYITIAHESDVLLQLRARFFGRAQILALLVDNARRRARAGQRGESGYDYNVPGQWQGRSRSLHVLGDKHAEGTSIRLLLRPELWTRVEHALDRPKLIHVVRNPFDSIASLIRPQARALDLAAATDYFFALGSTVLPLRRELGADRFCEVRHEDLVAAPAETLARLSRFLGEEPPADWLAACAAIVFPRPRRARERASWSAADVRRVEERMGELPFLEGYDSVG